MVKYSYFSISYRRIILKAEMSACLDNLSRGLHERAARRLRPKEREGALGETNGHAVLRAIGDTSRTRYRFRGFSRIPRETFVEARATLTNGGKEKKPHTDGRPSPTSDEA